MNKKGLTPIGKLITLIVLCAVGYFSYIKITEWSMETANFQAESDVKMIVSKIKKFKMVETDELTDLSQLKAKYLPTINNLKDPWGEKYLLDTGDEIVYSMGPDKLHSDEEDETWDDDVYESYTKDEDEEEDN